MLKNGSKTAFAQIGDFKIPSMKSETEVKPQVVWLHRLREQFPAKAKPELKRPF